MIIHFPLFFSVYFLSFGGLSRIFDRVSSVMISSHRRIFLANTHKGMGWKRLIAVSVSASLTLKKQHIDRSKVMIGITPFY